METHLSHTVLLYHGYFFCTGTDILFVCSLCRKNLGIASAGAAGLKEFTQSLNGWEVP